MSISVDRHIRALEAMIAEIRGLAEGGRITPEEFSAVMQTLVRRLARAKERQAATPGNQR